MNRSKFQLLFLLLSASCHAATRPPENIASLNDTRPQLPLEEHQEPDKTAQAIIMPHLTPETHQELHNMITSGNFAPIQFMNTNHSSQQQFYNCYLTPYYPRACVMGSHHFFTLSLEKIDEAIADIIKMFKDEPWFYFVDKPENFNHARYWEYIVDQLAIIHEFLVRLKVDLVTKKTFNPGQGIPSTAKKNAPFLLDHLLGEEFSGAAAESIALSYDYINKLFIDAIKREDVKDAVKYLLELEYLEQNLRITRFERDYHEHITNVVRSLFGLLKKRHNLSDEKIDQLRTEKKSGMFDHHAQH